MLARSVMVILFVMLTSSCGGDPAGRGLTGPPSGAGRTAAPATQASSSARVDVSNLPSDPSYWLAVVNVSPATAGGPYGSACEGAGPYSSVKYGTRVDYTAAHGTVHYSFLGDSEDSNPAVTFDATTQTCTFGLSLLKSGPLHLTIGDKTFDITAEDAAKARPVLNLP